MAHVDAVGVGEVIAQVGEGPGGALEVGAGDLHALEGREKTHVRPRRTQTRGLPVRAKAGEAPGGS